MTRRVLESYLQSQVTRKPWEIHSLICFSLSRATVTLGDLQMERGKRGKRVLLFLESKSKATSCVYVTCSAWRVTCLHSLSKSNDSSCCNFIYALSLFTLRPFSLSFLRLSSPISSSFSLLLLLSCTFDSHVTYAPVERGSRKYKHYLMYL